MKYLVVILLLLNSGCSTVDRADTPIYKNTHISDILIKVPQEDIKDRVEADRFEKILIDKETQ